MYVRKGKYRKNYPIHHFFGTTPKPKTLFKSEVEIIQHLEYNENNDKGFELISCYDQVKPYFDFDKEFDIGDDLENIELANINKI